MRSNCLWILVASYPGYMPMCVHCPRMRNEVVIKTRAFGAVNHVAS